jgi:hypothetical protein
LALLAIVILETPAFAVEKIRIGVPELNGQFVPLALAEKKGFFKEDGLQGEGHPYNQRSAAPAWDYKKVKIGQL